MKKFNENEVSTVVEFNKYPQSTQIPYIIHRQEMVGVVNDVMMDLCVDKGKFFTSRNLIVTRECMGFFRGMPNDVFVKKEYDTNPLSSPLGFQLIFMGTFDDEYKIYMTSQNIIEKQDILCFVVDGTKTIIPDLIKDESEFETLLNDITKDKVSIIRMTEKEPELKYDFTSFEEKVSKRFDKIEKMLSEMGIKNYSDEKLKVL